MTQYNEGYRDGLNSFLNFLLIAFALWFAFQLGKQVEQAKREDAETVNFLAKQDRAALAGSVVIHQNSGETQVRVR